MKTVRRTIDVSSSLAKPKAVGRRGEIQDFFGLLAGKTDKVASIEEICGAGWGPVGKPTEPKDPISQNL